MIPFSKFFLFIAGLIFVLIGVNTFRDPVAATTGIELVPSTVSGFSEVRANYGGLQIGIGLLLLIGALRADVRRHALWLVLAVNVGLISGRAASLFIDGRPNDVLMILLGLECIAASLATICLCFDNPLRIYD